MERKSEIKRKTFETDILLKLILESNEKSKIDSGVKFFDHMLNSMSRHGFFYLDLNCKGDLGVDDHHSVEDIGICLGRAVKDALRDVRGIRRFGESTIPMDDALSLVVVDISGRPYFRYNGPELTGKIGNYSEELTIEFMRSFATNAEINLHINVFYGDNRHHIHESIFKALGVSLYRAYSINPMLKNEVMSTKGSLYDYSD